MPKIGKRITDKKKMDQFHENLWDAIELLESKEEIRNFFYDFLTHTERKMLVKRFQVALMLVEGHGYETIKEVAEVSNSTVARLSNWLKTDTTLLSDLAKKLLEEGYPPYVKKVSGRKSHTPGDLLTPAIDGGLGVVAGRLAKRHRRKRTVPK
ncbi:YerC/YecD family TrpR-related protein [Patescibacteria group bacterium]